MASLIRSVRHINRSVLTKCMSLRYSSTISNDISIEHNVNVPLKRMKYPSFGSPVKQDIFVVDQQLHYLDTIFQLQGIVPKVSVEKVLQHIRQTGKIDSLQILQLIRYCGMCMIESTPSERNILVKELWDLLLVYNIPVDVFHYNALLRVHLENDHDFNPIELLNEMKNKNITPNKVTYQRFIEHYCKNGNITDTLTVLKCMKQELIPLNENIFNALILGYSESGNMETAVEVLDLMKANNVMPSSETYTMLMCAHAKCNDIDAVKKILREHEALNFTNKNIYDVMYIFIQNNNMEHIDDLLSYIKESNSFPTHDIYFIGKLIDIGQVNIALNILVHVARRINDHPLKYELIRSFLKRLLSCNVEPSVIGKVCSYLQKSSVYRSAFYDALQSAFKLSDENVVLDLLRYWKKTAHPIKPHYFWPVFTKIAQKHNFQGVLDTINCMKNEFDLLPCFDTLAFYVLPYNIEKAYQIREKLLSFGISDEVVDNAIVYYLLSIRKINYCVTYMQVYQNTYHSKLLIPKLSSCIYRNNDASSFVKIIRRLSDEVVGPHTFNRVTESLISLMQLQPPNKMLVGQVLTELQKVGMPVEPTVLNSIRTYLGDTTRDISDVLSSHFKSADPIQTNQLIPLDQTVTQYLNVIMKNQDLSAIDNPVKLQTELLKLIRDRKESNTMLHIIKKFESIGPLSPSALDIVIQFFCEASDIRNSKKYVQQLLKSNDFYKYVKAFKMYTQLLLKHHATRDFTELFHSNIDKRFLGKIFNRVVTEGTERDIKICIAAISNGMYNSTERAKLLIPAYIKIGDLNQVLVQFSVLCKENLGKTVKGSVIKAITESNDPLLMDKLIDICSTLSDQKAIVIDFFSCFIDSNKLNRAAKIMMRYDLSIHNHLIQRLLSEYVFHDKIDNIMKYLKLSQNISHEDRCRTYEHILRVCIIKNNWRIGLDLWIYMQEENFVPSKSFLNQLAILLTDNRQPVPFDHLLENVSNSI